jgi:cytochrome c oxidase subunit III
VTVSIAAHRIPGRVRRLDEYKTAARARSELTAWVGMVVFLASWAMLFASLFFAYALVRAHAPAWPPADQPRLPIALPGVNTGVILLSSCTLERALQGVRRGRPAARPLAMTSALGAAFLALQVLVWVRLYGEGLVPSGGPYASTFYTLTLFHALHVCVGLGAVAWLAARAAHAAARPLSVRLWTMYWHFVGGVWVCLYATLYLL